MFNCITGFYKPTEGRIALAPRRRRGLGRARDAHRQRQAQPARGDGALFLLERMPDYLVAQQARVARTFQNIRLFPGMTVLENLLVAQHNPLMLASGYTLLGVLGFAALSRRRARGDRAGARTGSTEIGLIDRADDPAGDLPYGAQRRLEIARAMCTDPVLLCLDEPAAGLNPRESAELNDAAARHPRRARHLDPADRARHVRGDGDFRPRRRARLRRQDRRRHARGRCATIPKVIAAYLGVEDEEVEQGRSGGRAMTRARSSAVRGVKTFYGNIMALKGVDLDVNEGEIVTLIGANGAGKSTLMMTIFGNPRAREGRIIFDGRDITQLPTHEIARLRIAQSPEGRRIFPRMTVLENLQMGATVADARAFRRRISSACFALFPRLKERLAPARRHAVGRRAADAGDRARADGRPRLLLLDEPSLGLAPLIVRADLRRHPRAQRATRGLTVFLVEQNAFHALKLAHRGYVMVNGADHAVAAPGANCWSGRRCEPPISKAAGTERADHACTAILYEEGSFGVFLLVTVILGGGAAWLAGPRHRRDLAAVLACWSLYMLILGARRALHPFRAVRAARCCRCTTTSSTPSFCLVVRLARLPRHARRADGRRNIAGSTSAPGRALALARATPAEREFG